MEQKSDQAIELESEVILRVPTVGNTYLYVRYLFEYISCYSYNIRFTIVGTIFTLNFIPILYYILNKAFVSIGYYIGVGFFCFTYLFFGNHSTFNLF